MVTSSTISDGNNSDEDDADDQDKPFTIEAARKDVVAYLTEQEESYFTCRGKTKAEVLVDSELIDTVAAEHYKCVMNFGNDREWSVKDACDVEPGIEDLCNCND